MSFLPPGSRDVPGVRGRTQLLPPGPGGVERAGQSWQQGAECWQPTPGVHSSLRLLHKVTLLEMRCLGGQGVAFKNSEKSVYSIDRSLKGKAELRSASKISNLS